MNKKISEELKEFIIKNSINHIKCDICGSEDKEVISTVARYGMPVTSVICKNCGLVYISPRMSDKSYETFYSDNRYYNSLDSVNAETLKECIKVKKDFAHRIINHLKEHNISIKGKRVLDVGCAEGFVLYPFKKEYGCYTCGLDCRDEVFEEGNKEGLNLNKGSIEDIKGKFDIIIISNVIEHLLNPKESLKKIRSHLSDNGILYASQEGIYSTKYWYGYDIEHYLRVEHTYSYSLKTFTNLLHCSGFEVIMGNEGIHTLSKKSDERYKIESDYVRLIKFIKECKRKKFKKLRLFVFNKSYPLLKHLKPLGVGWKNKINKNGNITC